MESPFLGSPLKCLSEWNQPTNRVASMWIGRGDHSPGSVRLPSEGARQKPRDGTRASEAATRTTGPMTVPIVRRRRRGPAHRNPDRRLRYRPRPRKIDRAHSALEHSAPSLVARTKPHTAVPHPRRLPGGVPQGTAHAPGDRRREGCAGRVPVRRQKGRNPGRRRRGCGPAHYRDDESQQCTQRAERRRLW